MTLVVPSVIRKNTHTHTHTHTQEQQNIDQLLLNSLNLFSIKEIKHTHTNTHTHTITDTPRVSLYEFITHLILSSCGTTTDKAASLFSLWSAETRLRIAPAPCVSLTGQNIINKDIISTVGQHVCVCVCNK
eukprot:GHVR01028697.1.p1 GENE.GHVR01028697.1~~GHVR01028697.1.p1  ORF type:complete len:131 (-),score=89.31 GHVR01028697.1:217-609(-)